jgi:glycosyltransferase involved in cell wall biosynthesis
MTDAASRHKGLKIAAIIGVRNERKILPACLRHLISEGIQYGIIDNGSTDGSRDLIESDEFKAHLVGYEVVPYTGAFELDRILEAKWAMCKTLDADWVIHHDSDEMMHSYRKDETLAEAISRIAGEQSCNVINFDEFVFLPVELSTGQETGEFPPMLSYYFFEPVKYRLMRAWKRNLGVSNISYGGHMLVGKGVTIAKESLALRHYIFQNQEHAFQKYRERRYAERNVKRGWHANRVDQPIENFKFPSASELERLPDPHSYELSRQRPRKTHYWQWERP